MSITEWPEDQRPREKLIKHGAHILSDAELLAVFLRVGVKGKSAVTLGNDILKHFGSLNQLFCAPLENFSQIHGLGPAKYAQIQAVLELARRTISEDLQKGLRLNSSHSVRNFLRLLIGNKTYESFAILFLDVKNRLLQSEELFHGSLSTAKVYPREVIKRALHHNAASVILAHNHPSGQTTPSPADIALTQELKRVLETIEVKVLDHFVVAGNQIYSFADHGLL
ncbi:DNA repair protein RadC [Oxalobacteraceae bacterium GrIS 2.11]